MNHVAQCLQKKMNEVKKITINTPEFYQREVAFQ